MQDGPIVTHFYVVCGEKIKSAVNESAGAAGELKTGDPFSHTALNGFDGEIPTG